MREKKVIIGIDGVPFSLIKELSERDIIPNMKGLIDDNQFSILKSSIPHISSVSWSSIITGRNPGEHGIYGFTELIENTYSLKFPNFNALKSPAFWHQKENRDKKHVIINVPSTYPAKDLNGVHIAGFVALDLEKAVYPNSLLPILENFNYKIDVDTQLAHKQSNELFFEELFTVLERRAKAFDHFQNNYDWDYFMPVITGSDRIGHFFWHMYEDRNHPYHSKFLEYFKKVDELIGKILKNLNEDINFIILSDHGMEGIDLNVNLNTFLQNEKYLFLSEKNKRYNKIMKGSKAFILDPGRVYLNKKGKYPNGTVTDENSKEILEQLKDLFLDLKYKNQKVINKIYTKEEIYSGKMVDYAPDLVLIENKGCNLKASIGKEKLFEKEEKFSGKHNDQAFIITNQELIKQPKVENVLKILEGI